MIFSSIYKKTKQQSQSDSESSDDENELPTSSAPQSSQGQMGSPEGQMGSAESSPEKTDYRSKRVLSSDSNERYGLFKINGKLLTKKFDSVDSQVG